MLERKLATENLTRSFLAHAHWLLEKLIPIQPLSFSRLAIIMLVGLIGGKKSARRLNAGDDFKGWFFQRAWPYSAELTAIAVGHG